MPSKSAENVIDKCGGAEAVAQMLGINVSTVHRWKYSRAKGGTGGRVPTAQQGELLSLALRAGIVLTPADFFDVEAVAA